ADGPRSGDLGTLLARLVRRWRPELDVYLTTDRDVAELAGSAEAAPIRRIFYGVEEPMEIHLAILDGVKDRYETPYFDNLKRYAQRPIGTFHALPVARGKSDRKRTRLNSRHVATSYTYTLPLRDALPIGRRRAGRLGRGRADQAHLLRRRGADGDPPGDPRRREGSLRDAVLRQPQALRPASYRHLPRAAGRAGQVRSEAHTSELQARGHLLHLHPAPPRRSPDRTSPSWPARPRPRRSGASSTASRSRWRSTWRSSTA